MIKSFGTLCQLHLFAKKSWSVTILLSISKNRTVHCYEKWPKSTCTTFFHIRDFSPSKTWTAVNEKINYSWTIYETLQALRNDLFNMCNQSPRPSKSLPGRYLNSGLLTFLTQFSIFPLSASITLSILFDYHNHIPLHHFFLRLSLLLPLTP